jgi:hypothetical protein
MVKNSENQVKIGIFSCFLMILDDSWGKSRKPTCDKTIMESKWDFFGK